MKRPFRTFAALTFLTSTSVFAQEPRLTIDRVSYSGDMCPQGSVAQYVSADQQVFTIIYDQFTLHNQGAQGRTNEVVGKCQLKLKLGLTPGWVMALPELEVRGYARLDRGIKGSQRVYYSFVGEYSPMAWQDFVGPMDDNYKFESHITPARLAWSACSGQDGINLELISMGLLTSRGPGEGLLTVDTTDGNFEQNYTVRFLPCSESPKLLASRQTIYRFIHPRNGNHVLSGDPGEASRLMQQGYRSEGGMFHTLRLGTDPSLHRVYRMRNPNNDFRYLSTNLVEISYLKSLGWTDDNISMGAVFAHPTGGMIPIYRVYNSQIGSHLFTSNQGERDALLRIPATVWQDHGILGYTMP
jgi:hypothetical protein